MRREGALRVPLDTARKGIGRALHTAHTLYVWHLVCVCDLHTRVCRPIHPAGRPTLIERGSPGPN